VFRPASLTAGDGVPDNASPIEVARPAEPSGQAASGRRDVHVMFPRRDDGRAIDLWRTLQRGPHQGLPVIIGAVSIEHVYSPVVRPIFGIGYLGVLPGD
jgi:hypothetical protein